MQCFLKMKKKCHVRVGFITREKEIQTWICVSGLMAGSGSTDLFGGL
jgi:hypothetical protein